MPETSPNTTQMKKINALQSRFIDAQAALKQFIFGQDLVIEQVMTALLSGGHVLLVGLPGLAKTMLVTSLASVTGLKSARIQSTPDLMPGDILGIEVLDEDSKGKRNFRFVKGPIFTNLLIADEINRASPRTQSALLQAMQEKHVTVAGKDHKIPDPFHVIATQNPIEQDGTYPLPEAQLDRFFMEIHVDYPSREVEKQMLALTGQAKPKLTSVMSAKEFQEAQALIHDIPVGEKVVDAILELIAQLRPNETSHAQIKELVEWAPGPRGSQALLVGAKARAFLRGENAASIEDVIELAVPVLQHRMALSFAARSENLSAKKLIEEICAGL